MKTNSALGALFLACAFGASATPISITDLNTGYIQDFDTLASSGTSSTVPAGWEFIETGTSANTTYSAGTGSGTTGNTYSFGASGSLERALGGLRSGTLVPTIGVAFQNDTLALINSFQISYVGEQWRLGTAGRADRLDFQFSTDATSLTTGTWTDFDALDFSSPSTGTVGALDGNASATALSAAISVPWAAGATLWIRWSDFDASNSDDGLAVDNFSIKSVAAVPETLPLAVDLAVLLALFSGARCLARRRTGAAVH